MESVEKILAVYAEVDFWKKDHDAAVRCLEAEEIVAFGSMTFRLVSSIEATWQGHIATGLFPYSEEGDKQFALFYRTWVEISERHLVEVEKLAKDGYKVEGVEEFQAELDEAKSLLESRALESEMLAIGSMSPLIRGNPRPERYGE